MGRSVFLAVVLVVIVLSAAYVIYKRGVVENTGGGNDPIASVKDAGPKHDVTAPPAADAGVRAGPVDAEIIAARGKVEAKQGEKGPWTDAEVGKKLSTDDSVRAGRNAEATLRMGNGVEVRLSPRSEFTIRELSEGTSKIRLDEGHVTASVDENGKRTLKVAARGTDAEAESKGGEFGVVTDGKGQLAVATTTGSVKLTAGGQSVDVGAGQESNIAGGVPAQPRAIPSSLFLKVGELGSAKTKETSTTVSGTTDPGTLVKIGDATAKVDERGKFSMKVPLKDGVNTIAVEVIDASGRTKTAPAGSVTVDRKAPSIDATTKWGTPPPTPPPATPN